MIVDEEGYLTRQTSGGQIGSRGKKIFRDWWLVKSHANGYNAVVNISTILLHKKYIGKKVKLKLEVVKEKRKK
tara:strand:+ start:365 stop:583 length:219 start_codon:yes stop_codon:yes gene_type:complete